MAVMALASCVKEESVPQNVICDSHERLTVYASTGNMSKTALDSEFNVLWSEGDKIKFVSADKSKEFTFTLSSGEGTTTGTFTLDEGQQVPADGSYIVFYPSTYDGSNYPVQKYLGDNVISGAPMKAEMVLTSGESNNMNFQNAGGILRYTIKGNATLASINISCLDPSTPLDVNVDCGTGVTLDNDNGTVFNIAVKPGKYKNAVLRFITTDNKHAHLSAEEFIVKRNSVSLATISNLKFTPIAEYVDLGLPSGNLWATCNLGAAKETDFGQYFTWGNADGVTITYDMQEFFDWYFDGPIDIASPKGQFTEEHYQGSSGYEWAFCKRLPATATYDAACKYLGQGWHVPSEADFQELYDNTDIDIEVHRDVQDRYFAGGWRIRSRKDPNVSIFIPFAGYCYPSDDLWLANECRYWTNATSADNPQMGQYLKYHPDFGYFHFENTEKNYGLPIRAVYNTKEPEPLPKDDLLPGVFTFNNKRVQFSKGNLWCDTRSNPTTSNFHFEDEQYKSYPVTNNEVVSDTHVSHFSWFETMAEAVKHHAFNRDGYEQNFIFAAHNFTVGTSGGWQMMSLNDWVDEPGSGQNAFVNRKDSKGRLLMKTFPEICGVKCAVYLPDDWDLDRFPVKDSYDADTWAAAESRGAVCFPLAGCHGGGYKDYPLKELTDYNVDGHYWTTDIFVEPSVKQSAWAICLPTDYGFHQWAKFTYFDSYGCSIRLVKEKK